MQFWFKYAHMRCIPRLPSRQALQLSALTPEGLNELCNTQFHHGSELYPVKEEFCREHSQVGKLVDVDGYSAGIKTVPQRLQMLQNQECHVGV